LQNDPSGGVRVLVAHPPGLLAFDAKGDLRWQVPLDDGTAVFAVDRAGNTLVLTNGASRFADGAVAGQWFDASGTAGPVFQAGTLPPGTPIWVLNLYPRVGSGLFLQTVGTDSSSHVRSSWFRQLDSMATSGTAAPDWLTARPDTRLHMARGGTAYAMLPQPGATPPTCSQQIEVVAPSGKTCGTVTFTISATSCRTKSIDVGYEGTVIQQLPSEMEQQNAAGQTTCSWRFWPALLQ
jgi:uncharacterized protein YodC (DUF2158 family)